MEAFLGGLEALSQGKLSQFLIHPRRLQKLLRKVVKDVTSKNTQFVPVYTELYHYYETHSVSFTNTDEYIIIQIPTHFINKKQAPLNLYHLHKVPVPLDKDTYDGHESKYTQLQLDHSHLAISDQEYIDLSEEQLSSCLHQHENYLCSNIRFTASTQKLSCAAALFQVKPPDDIVRERCSITYYEHLEPSPMVLETQDEILLANLPPTWQLVCDNEIDRPIPLESAIYAVVKRDDLCTCGILAQHIFLYESMHTCEKPDTSIQLYYTYNRALKAYDPSLAKKAVEHYYTYVPDCRAPDIVYTKQLALQQNPTSTTRKCWNADEDTPAQEVSVSDLMHISFPMCDAVELVDSGTPYEIVTDQGTCIQECNSTPFAENPDFYFNVVTVVNFIAAVTNGFIFTCVYTRCHHFLTTIVGSVLETMEQAKQVKALKSTDEEDPIETT